jgi:hypothetical protein
LLPDSIKHPFVLFWIAVLPQIVLLLINLRAFWLVSGEFAPWQKAMSLRIFALEILLLLSFLVGAGVLLVLRKRISWALNWPLLIAPVLYLWLVTYQIGGPLIPESVTAWILPPGQLLYYQFCFMMPVVFYAGVRLACLDLKLSLRSEIAWLAAVGLGPPMFWYLLFYVGAFFFLHNLAGQFAVTVLVAGIVTTGLLALAALTRACVRLYVAMRKKGPLALGILSFFVGIAAPLAGLWLNAYIPFPSDFQAWPVYAMAIANGCALLLPNFRHPLLHRVVWLSQCLFFPFTFYFFVIFLPFLPLSAPAMIAAGAGFLILTPTALFLVHGQRILDGYGDEIRDGSRRRPAVLGVLALAVLPLIFVGQAVFDRLVLREAIDYIYSPNLRRADHFTGNRQAVGRSLEHLRDYKAGLYLPFLSDFYSWTVFDNLVLPDEKMNAIHYAFFGRDLSPAREDRISIFGGQPTRGRTLREARRIAAPRSDVALVDLTATTTREEGCERTTFTLDLQNRGAPQSEFVTQIEIPEGVLVSGFWLKIDDERVPGKLFERKSALWVYQMIRDRSRRDPGILVYSDPNSIELRVFPFSEGERRRVEVQLLYPAVLHPTVKIGEREWKATGDAAGICVASTDEGTSAVAFTPQAIAHLPGKVRVPYLHFIVDHSADAALSDADVIATIQNAARQLTGARECFITTVNYECADVTPKLLPIGSITAATLHEARALPLRGGFLMERAMKRALLTYHDQLSQSQPASPWLEKFPLIVVIRKGQGELPIGRDLAHFARLAPDVDRFYVAGPDGPLKAFDFAGKAVATTNIVHPVAVLQMSDSISVCKLDEGESQLVQFYGNSAKGSLNVLDQNGFRGLEATAMVDSDTAYSRGLSAWQRYLSWIYDPSLGNNGLAAVVDLSRESGILVEATSYIVVENSAQWKMLDLKQRQKLRHQNVLEFDQVAVPEPEAWLLVVIGGGVFFYAILRRHRSSGGRGM